MRFLFFFLTALAIHALGARWVLGVSAWARARRRWVWSVAGLLSATIAVVRLTRPGRSELFHDLRAVVFAELAIVAISLVPLAVVTILARTTVRIAARVRPPASPEESAARIGRREAIEKVCGAAVVGVSSATIGWGVVRGRHAFALEEVAVRVVGWPRALDGYVIAQVSDIHCGAFVGERELAEGFELVRRIRPDLVVATGDLVDIDADSIRPLLRHLEDVGARDGAHAILGNHDHYAHPDLVAERIAASRVRLLDNACARIRAHEGGGFALLGVDDIHGRTRGTERFAGPDLSRATRELPAEIPRILLAHQPVYFQESAGSVALQLSGHTHGGQINPGFTPARALMEFVAGRYERSGSTLWVNRGFGVVGPPARVGAPPEVTKIVIVAA